MTDHNITTLKTDIIMGECTRWHDGRIWFADWLGGAIYAVDDNGTSQTMAKIQSLPLSFDWDASNRCFVVNSTARKLQILADGQVTDFADLSEAPFSYNEIVIDDAGHIYLNNINFQFPGGDFSPGFIVLVTPDGEIIRQQGELAFPNGMVITPDGKTLICAESYNGRLTAFDIARDGTLSNQRLWAQIDGQGGDGICIDAEGAIWASSGKRCLRISEGGAVLDTVPLDRMAFACMLGGSDGKTLYIAANEWNGKIDPSQRTGRLLSTPVAVPHAGFPRR
ncbi:sugar lactone lactonase YvrE [Devosia sp. UYZn731]|uniref:SMP-30/gluconolactonase/LRE family protein n=1 Tax=Devosia sp. UYZn731 TaxID=3156345 RepID=UPI0033952C94